MRMIARFIPAALLLAANPSFAQRCDAYYPFEDSLADIGGNGFDGQMITADGAAATPEFAEGRIGRALRITDGAAMRAFADLHYDRCPQVTITAWIKLESLDSTDNQYVFSTGQGSGPGLYTQGPALRLNGTENGLYYPGAIRDANTWFLVAGIYDYELGTYSLYWRNDIVAEGRLSDSRYGAEDAFWIGTQNDNLAYTAKSLYVDELRVVGSILSEDDITRLSQSTFPATASPQTARDLSDIDRVPDPFDITLGGETIPGSTCAVQEDCGTGTYCAFDGTCHPESHLPRRDFELSVVDTTQLPVLPDREDMSPEDVNALMAERNARRTAGIVYDSPAALLEQLRDASQVTEDSATSEPTPEESAPPAAERRVVGWRLSASDVVLSPVSGTSGDNQIPVELDGSILTGIDIWEPNDVPCEVGIWGDEAGSAAVIDRCATPIFPGLNLINETIIRPAAVESVRVCQSYLTPHLRVKGISISGHEINADGSLSFYHEAKDDTSNCRNNWRGVVHCPTRHVASGLVLHFRERNGSDALIGIQLICRRIELIYE